MLYDSVLVSMTTPRFTVFQGQKVNVESWVILKVQRSEEAEVPLVLESGD